VDTQNYRAQPTIALLTVAGGAVQWKAAAEARAIRYFFGITCVPHAKDFIPSSISVLLFNPSSL